MDHFLDVVLPIPLERLFTYRISPREAEFIRPGMRVAVPFGKSKIYTALAHGVHQNAPTAYDAKEIYQILDEVPLVSAIQLKHWKWVADYYMCSLGEVVRSALPGAFLLESETLILPNKEAEVDEMGLADDEFLVFEALQHHSSLTIAEISDIVDRKNVLALVDRLVQKGVALQREELYERYRPKLVRYVKLSPSYGEGDALEELLKELSRAPKQSQVLLALFQWQAKSKKPISIQDLERESGSSKAVIKALVAKGILEEFHIRKDRVGYEGESQGSGTIVPNQYQERALEEIGKGFAQDRPVLLQGVTASGKTEVYIKLLQKCLDRGKQSLYLLPEIALTSQLIDRLRGYFGSKVSVYHSKYSIHERVEVWNNVRKGAEKAQIVIGARSSLFLPFPELGLVVVDEEHDSSYKQFDPAPRYHARDRPGFPAPGQGRSGVGHPKFGKPSQCGFGKIWPCHHGAQIREGHDAGDPIGGPQGGHAQETDEGTFFRYPFRGHCRNPGSGGATDLVPKPQGLCPGGGMYHLWPCGPMYQL